MYIHCGARGGRVFNIEDGRLLPWRGAILPLIGPIKRKLIRITHNAGGRQEPVDGPLTSTEGQLL